VIPIYTVLTFNGKHVIIKRIQAYSVRKENSPGHLVVWKGIQIFSGPLLANEHHYHHRPEQSLEEREKLNALD